MNPENEQYPFEILLGLLPVKVTNRSELQVVYNREMTLVKSCLLYGDRVNLQSIGLQKLSALRMLSSLPDYPSRYIEVLNALAFVLPIFTSGSQLDSIYSKCKKLKKKGSLDSSERQRVDRLINAFRPVINDLFAGISFNDMDAALESGLVKIKTPSGVPYYEDQAKEYLNTIIEALRDRKSYPFLDEILARSLQRGSTGRLLEDNALKLKARHAGLAVGLVVMLPSFSFATVDQLIRIRSELEGPLIRFRASISDLSREINKEQWNPDFEIEVSDIYQSRIRPAVQELNEEIRANKYTAHLWNRLAVDQPDLTKGAWGAAGGLFGIDQLNLCIHPITNTMLLAAMAACTGLSVSAFTAWIDHRQAHQQIQGNSMYFYQQVGQGLE